ncbi:MAG: hypothetical protein ABIH23_04950 [bacterium]
MKLCQFEQLQEGIEECRVFLENCKNRQEGVPAIIRNDVMAVTLNKINAIQDVLVKVQNAILDIAIDRQEG